MMKLVVSVRPLCCRTAPTTFVSGVFQETDAALLQFAPLLEIAVAGSPFRKLSRQHPPLTAALEHIGHTTEDLIQVHFAWASFLSCPFPKLAEAS